MTFSLFYTIATGALALYGLAHLCRVFVGSVLAQRGRADDVAETLLVGFCTDNGEVPDLPVDACVKLRFVGKPEEERVELAGRAAPERLERDAKCQRIAALNPHHKWFAFEVDRFDLGKIPVQRVEIDAYGLDGKRHYSAVMDPECDHFIDPPGLTFAFTDSGVLTGWQTVSRK